ncbi:MAG: hypothetical protein K2H53_01805, partial [Clostridia bacterium]|nr:hypothetical protein [Clostridia bacterium]
SDEQTKTFEDKLKEKYNSFSKNSEKDTNIVEIIDMPSVNAYDLVREYIKPIAITFIITVIILWVLFRKLGWVKALVIPACIIIVINALYISVISILRIPVNEYAISIGLVVYAVSLIGTACYTKIISEN